MDFEIIHKGVIQGSRLAEIYLVWEDKVECKGRE
jgi:hypothetical protein